MREHILPDMEELVPGGAKKALKKVARGCRCVTSRAARVHNVLHKLDEHTRGTNPQQQLDSMWLGRTLYLTRLLKDDVDVLHSVAITAWEEQVTVMLWMVRRHLSREQWDGEYESLLSGEQQAGGSRRRAANTQLPCNNGAPESENSSDEPCHSTARQH